MHYGENDDLVKCIVHICSHGFEGNLVCIFLTFLQISMNFESFH
jgi:hypothetical protein